MNKAQAERLAKEYVVVRTKIALMEEEFNELHRRQECINGELIEYAKGQEKRVLVLGPVAVVQHEEDGRDYYRVEALD